MKKLIAIYGGTDLFEAIPLFVEQMSFAILKNIRESIIVTGGFEYKTNNGERIQGISTDWSASIGAEKFAKKNKEELSTRLKTWIPELEKDRNDEHVKRFKKGDWEIVKGKSAQARRFEIAQKVDAIVTIKGRKNTAMLLDFAIATDKPFLPLAFTGEDSKKYWEDNEELIKKKFAINDSQFIEQIKNFKPSNDPSKNEKFIQDIIEVLKKGLQKTCLVLRGYETGSDNFYNSHLKHAIELAGFMPVDIKEEINNGNILTIFLKKLETCDAIIADITDANPNVMYELGQAHGRGFPVVLYSRKIISDETGERLPFYLAMDKVENGDASNSKGINDIIKRINEHLTSKKK